MRKSLIGLPAAALLLALAACALPLYKAPQATPTVVILATPTLIPPTAVTPSPTLQPVNTMYPTVQAVTAAATQAQAAGTQPSSADFCADGQVTTLINNFKTALQTSNGELFASVVSPTHGMDARYYRDGRVVNYDREHIKFVFETVYVVDWGRAPGSGLEYKGSFHEVILPALLDVFNKVYTLTCDQVQVGGTSYHATWPYTGIHFYSVYFPGSQGNASLDWHTWLLGIHYVNGKPYLYAIMQFQWEP